MKFSACAHTEANMCAKINADRSKFDPNIPKYTYSAYLSGSSPRQFEYRESSVLEGSIQVRGLILRKQLKQGMILTVRYYLHCGVVFTRNGVVMYILFPFKASGRICTELHSRLITHSVVPRIVR